MRSGGDAKTRTTVALVTWRFLAQKSKQVADGHRAASGADLMYQRLIEMHQALGGTANKHQAAKILHALTSNKHQGEELVRHFTDY